MTAAEIMAMVIETDCGVDEVTAAEVAAVQIEVLAAGGIVLARRSHDQCSICYPDVPCPGRLVETEGNTE